MAYDPDRRGERIARLGRSEEEEGIDYSEINRRQPTDGPGGAASFYPPTYASDPNLGTGTDGFGAGVKPAPSNSRLTHDYDDVDYRATFKRPEQQQQQRRGDAHAMPEHAKANGAHRVQPFGGALDEEEGDNFDTLVSNQRPPHAAHSALIVDRASSQDVERGGISSPFHYNPSTGGRGHEHQHQQYAQRLYPPQNLNGNSQSTFDLHTPLAGAFTDRPDTPGIYRDRAPRMEKLSPAQQEIAKSFPKDLDEEGGSLIKTAIAMCKDWRSFIKWKYVHYYIILAVLCALVALMTIYHHQIVDWLTPLSRKVRELSWGWVIPVVILFVISFPPLFGHEIVGVLCGVVYGLWLGFGILSLGTLLGELGNFYAFKYFLKKHGEKYETKSIDYACMAHIVREGGFLVILLARLSAIPGHFTTAVFATVGMNIFVFTLAAVLSLPKQLVVVYLGVAIEQSGSGNESTQSKVIKWVVLIASFAVTVAVAVYLYGRMQKARPIVQERLREKRFKMLTEAAQNQSKEGVSGGSGNGPSPSEEGFVGERTSKVTYASDEEGGLGHGKSTEKRSFWNRVIGRGKGKASSSRARDPRERSEIAMQTLSRASFDGTDSVGHQKMAQYEPYDDQVRGMTFAEQYMQPQSYNAGGDLAGVHQHVPSVYVEQNAYQMPQQQQHDRTYEAESEEKYLAHQEPRGRLQPSLYEQQRDRSQQTMPSHYTHAPNVGSIYRLPEGSEEVHRHGETHHEHERSTQSAYMMAM